MNEPYSQEGCSTCGATRCKMWRRDVPGAPTWCTDCAENEEGVHYNPPRSGPHHLVYQLGECIPAVPDDAGGYWPWSGPAREEGSPVPAAIPTDATMHWRERPTRAAWLQPLVVAAEVTTRDAIRRLDVPFAEVKGVVYLAAVVWQRDHGYRLLATSVMAVDAEGRQHHLLENYGFGNVLVQERLAGQMKSPRALVLDLLVAGGHLREVPPTKEWGVPEHVWTGRALWADAS